MILKISVQIYKETKIIKYFFPLKFKPKYLFDNQSILFCENVL